MLAKLSMLICCISAFAFSSISTDAELFKKSAGIMIAGTQTEVKAIMEGSGYMINFSEQDPNAQVVVALTRQGMKIYERGAAQDIIKFIGGVVQGGVVLTVKIGTALWDLLQNTACTTVAIGKNVLKAAAWILTHTTAVIKSGVTFAEETAKDILHFVGDLLRWIFGL